MADKASANRFYAGATAIVIASLLLVSGIVWFFRPPQLDVATLCPVDKAISGHTVVVVDRTDRWNPTMATALKDVIDRAQHDTKDYAKFSIVSLDANDSATPLFSVCNPGSPTLLTDLYRGRRYTKRDFDEKFVGAAESVVAQVSQPSEAGSSPIVEYVHRWLGRDDFNETVKNRRMVLISDMRQNSGQFSIYAAKDKDGLGPVVEKQFGPAAKSVDFEIYFVPHGHDGRVSEDQVHAAWDQAFKKIAANYEWKQVD